MLMLTILKDYYDYYKNYYEKNYKKYYLITDDETHFALVQNLMQPKGLVGDDEDGRGHSGALLTDELR